MVIGDKIKYLREEHGLTQTMLAKKLCITRSAVNAWELGISVPSTALIIEISRLFHVSSDYLLGLENTATLDISVLSQEEIEILYTLIKYFKSKKENQS